MSMLYLKPAVYKEKWTDEQLELEDIKDIISVYYRIKSTDIDGCSRKAEIRRPRQVFHFLACRNTRATLVDIGKSTGKDHSTVIHSKKTIYMDMAYDNKLCSDLDRLQDGIDARLGKAIRPRYFESHRDTNLSLEEINAIKDDLDSFMPIEEILDKYNTTHRSIYKIKQI
jgi:hypothetical protein